MRIWILVLLMVAQSRASVTILSQRARNVKNGAAYGGVSAVGDGVKDDTQAFLDALNIGRYRAGQSFSPVAIYVPPGTYLVSKTLLLWGNTFLFGEPSSPPTVVLAANSPGFASGANPFVVTVGGYNVPAYSTNWRTRTDSFNGSTNNTFFIDVHDINFTVRSGNPGCSDVFLYACAQQNSLRNSVLTGDHATADCLRTDLTGGGGIIQAVTCNGGQVALQANDTVELLYRGCVFNGPVHLTGGTAINFVDCVFNNNKGTGLVSAASWFALDDCSFSTGTPFTPGGYSGWHFHLENTKWQNLSSVPSALQPYANSSGKLAQYTNNQSYDNGTLVSGTSATINASAKGSPYANPDYPRPTSKCVNVMNYGATGNGSTDDTLAIKAAYTASQEVFFPTGNYKVSSPLTLSAGMKMFGQGASQTILNITTSSNALSVTGNGIAGVVISGVTVNQLGSGGSCLLWNGNSSSIVLDSRFLLTATQGTDVIFQSGGGFFENGWWPANSGSAVGVQINSVEPLSFYSVQPEHYKKTAVVYNAAQNVFWLNLEMENSPAFVSIIQSAGIFIQGIVCGNAPIAIATTRSKINLFGVTIGDNAKGVVAEYGLFYGPSGSGSNTLDGYVSTGAATPAATPGSSPH